MNPLRFIARVLHAWITGFIEGYRAEREKIRNGYR